mgnify:CR=1 FL=1
MERAEVGARTAKAQSVRQDGEPDGWVPVTGFVRDVSRQGETQVVVSAAPDQLARVHRGLLDRKSVV